MVTPSLSRVRSRLTMDATQAKRIVFFLLGVFALLGWIYVFFLSDTFTIQGIALEEGTGLDPIAAKGIVLQTLDKRSAWRPWSPRHAFFLDTKQLEEQLKEQWFAEEVQVRHAPWERILRLNVRERTNRLVVHSKQQFLWVDIRGFVTQELSLDERQTILARLQGRQPASAADPLIVDFDLQELVAAGYRVADPTVVRTWLELDATMKSRHLLYRSIEIPDGQSISQASLVLMDGVSTYVDTQENVLGQINALAKFMEYTKTRKKEAGINPTEYIDVRIPGRVYVK